MRAENFFLYRSASLYGAVLTALVPLSAYAQSAPDAFEQVVVVANRAPVNLSQVGNSVTVLDEATIQQRQSTQVSDLLSQTPSVTMSSNGGPGTITAIRIRGAEAGQTLVLIDGVQMNDPSAADGSFDFGNLLVDDISRIEILRGSQSALYGSQAIGGVVNIITAEPQAEGLTGNAQAEMGSLATGMMKGGIGGKFGKLTFRIAGGYYNTDSVSAFDKHYGGKETDPDRNETYTGRATYDVTQDISLDLRALYIDGKYNYDGFPAPAFVFADEGDYGTTRQFVGYGGVNASVFDGRLKNRFDYQTTSIDRGTFLNTGTAVTGTGSYSGDNHRLEYQGNLAIADGYDAVFGFQNENTQMRSVSAPSFAHTWTNSYYVQAQGEVIPGLTLTAGGREDSHKTFGDHFTGQFAAAWKLDTGTILRASWGQGFKAPALYQLYSTYGTLNLKPEESISWDGSVGQHLLSDALMLSAGYFSRHSNNLISFQSCPGTSRCVAQPFGYYFNTGRTVTAGVELQGSYAILPNLLLTSNFTHEIARDRSPGASTYGKLLPRRPNDTWNSALDYTWDIKLSTGISILYRSSSFNDAANLVRLKGYALISLRASYPINDNFDLYGRIDNAADQFYETSYQYGTWGRTAFVGMRAHF